MHDLPYGPAPDTAPAATPEGSSHIPRRRSATLSARAESRTDQRLLKTMNAQEHLMTKEQAAQVLGISVSGLNKLIARRRIRYVKVGRMVRFSPRTLDADIEKMTVKTVN
jgi:excisionase family DNA binding protein